MIGYGRAVVVVVQRFGRWRGDRCGADRCGGFDGGVLETKSTVGFGIMEMGVSMWFLGSSHTENCALTLLNRYII